MSLLPLSPQHISLLETQHLNLYSLMKNAGSESAYFILAHTPPHASFIILAGPGNNGGDTLIIAHILARHNRQITLFSPPPSSSSSSSLHAQALLDTKLLPLPLSQFSPSHFSQNSIIIDGLFGTGINRNLTGDFLNALSLCARHPHIPLFAIDILSGASANTGHLHMTPPFPKAQYTLTFHRPKIGHFIHPTKNISGKIITLNIGLPNFHHHIPPLPSDPLIPNHPSLWQNHLPSPSLNAHKYTKGVLAIKASPSMPGASILAAKAAKKTGCGMVILFSPPSHTQLFLSLCDPSTIVIPFANPLHLAELINQDTRITAALLGSGDTNSPSLLPLLAKLSLPLVLDAGIFNVSPSQLIDNLKNRTPLSAVLTPHDGEYARIFSPPPHLTSRPERALFASQLTQQTLLLKGNDTAIASPSYPTVIETLASPSLATAGSGDVLAGFIAGLLAQNITPHLAACYASHIHSQAALSQPYPQPSAENLIP